MVLLTRAQRRTTLVVAQDGDGDYNGTDETPINSAISALSTGGTIILGSGTYTLANTITITQNNITIKGQGDRTIIKAADGLDANIIRVNATDLTLESFSIDGNKANLAGSSHGVSTEWNAHRLKCDNLYVHDTYGIGIGFNNCDDVKIRNCRIEDIGDSGGNASSTGFGISATSSENFEVSGNRIKNTHSDNIFVSGTNPQVSQHFLITNNRCSDVNTDQRSNITVYEGQAGTVSINTCFDNADNTKGVNGIYIRGANGNTNADCMVLGNIVYDVSGVGIEIQNGGCSVGYNRINLTGTGDDANGLWIGGDDVEIIGNIIEDATQHGIAINGGVDNIKVIGNTVRNVKNTDADASCVRCICASGTQSRVKIVGNDFVDEQGTPTCEYGIYCTGAGTFTKFTVLGNEYTGMQTAETNGVPNSVTQFDGSLSIIDGVSAPDTKTGHASIYVDTADGDLKVKFGDGTVAVIAADT